MTVKLYVYSAQDTFGPNLMGEPYWRAEVYETADQRELWAAGYGSWLEAMRGGMLAWAEKRADASRSQFWDDHAKDMRDPKYQTAYVDESLRIEWEQAMAREAMDMGPICRCSHAQLEHGETRCKHCDCQRAWWDGNFSKKAADEPMDPGEPWISDRHFMQLYLPPGTSYESITMPDGGVWHAPCGTLRGPAR